MKRILLTLVMLFASVSAHAQIEGNPIIEIPPDWDQIWAEAWKDAIKKSYAEQRRWEKSNVVMPIPLPYPSARGIHAEPAIIEKHVRGLFVLVNAMPGFNPLRSSGAFFGVGGVYYEFVYMLLLPKATVRMYVGDTFRGVFQDGSTIEFKFVGIPGPSGHCFLAQIGTERDAEGNLFADNPPPRLFRPLIPILDATGLNAVAGRVNVDGSGFASFDRTWMTTFRWGYAIRNQR